MFGIQTIEIVLLVKQLGIVVAGAAALWGWVFSHKSHSCGSTSCLMYDWIASKLSALVFAGVALAAFAFVFGDVFVFAHEGIVVFPTASEVTAALAISQPLLLAITLIAGAGCFIKTMRPQLFARHIRSFFAVMFVLLFVSSALLGWTGSLSDRQFFFFGHGFHSIFTLGTVIVLDFLFLLSKRSDILKQHIFPLFPLISKVVWVGLAFDFASALLIIEYFEVTQKFLFMQTIIGILIINGTLLSGPITRKVLASIKEGGEEMDARWYTFANLAGTISISSWMTITVVDYFQHLTLEYTTLLGGFVLLVCILFVGHEIMERVEARKEAPQFS